MKVDCVVKLGGSLLYDVSLAKKMLDALYDNNSSNIVVTIGSGYLGEVYKKFLSDNGIEPGYDDSVRDWSNIQSINASIIASINNNYVVCSNLNEIETTLLNEKIPIIDSRAFIDVFKNNQVQKSDVRTASICKYLNCSNLIIVTDVSGIYESDPKKCENAKIIERISAEDLIKLGRTSVDNGLAEKIIEYDLNCYVLGIKNILKYNGKMEEDVLSTGTKIRRKVYDK